MKTPLSQHPMGTVIPVQNFFQTVALQFTILLFSISTISHAQTLPSGFSQVMVASGISNPTVMAFAPDRRIFVAQQNGQLRIIKNGSLLSQPFISLSVSSSGERGLLGIAFDPNFSSNNYIYLYYTLSSGSNNRISRFTANGDVVVQGSEQVLLNLDPLSSATNHNGGTMMFGPDGKLYIGVGENADASYSQQTDTYHGKLLRINPDGSVPSGNPFSSGGEQQRRIWSYGLRNPFTIAFQPGTGRLFVNDVGASSWEEINDATTGGKNFGWPQTEGYGDNSSFSDPVYAYGHGQGVGSGCAITGGTFFNPSSTNYPSSYNGGYFFLDFCNNWIDMLTLNGGSASRSNFASNIAGGPVSLITGTDGNLYFLSRDNGAVYRIVYAGGSSAPLITTQPQNITIAQGNSATFRVTATGTAPLSYQWRKNGTNINGATSSSYTISNPTATDAGNYSVVVSNSAGSVTSNSATLTVTSPNQAPVATITSPAAGSTYAGGDIISFSGSATDPEQGTLSGVSFTWYVIFHHDTHTHPGPTATAGAANGSFTIPNSGETASNVFYRLYLIVTDAQGARDTAYRDIIPRTSSITLNTNPQGLTITLDGQPFTAPLTVTSVEGILRTIGTTSTQTQNSQTYNFSNWSNGGAQTQSFATPANNVSYTANFTVAATLPAITQQPQNITVTQGNRATFSVAASGTAPLSYQWRRNGVNIAGATNSSFTIAAVSTDNAGNYSVVVSNTAGSVTSNTAVLTVTSSPVITSQPQSITIGQGGNATFRVTATGTAPLTYQWRRNGINITGATNSTYSISSVTTANAANYSVVVSNNYGSSTSSIATLTVTTAPVITSQPQSVTVVQGAIASFSVTATGTAPLTYQWRRNGVNINGAINSSYSISSVTSANAGNYSVAINNAYGTVTSNNANLTVTSQPNTAPIARIVSPVQGTTYAGGEVINFSGTGTDTEDGNLNAAAFHWFVRFYHHDHVHAGPAISTGVTNGSLTIPATGETATDVFYRIYLVVTDEQGAKDTAYRDLLPRTSIITLNTNPQGLNVVLDGQLYKAPLTVTSVEGVLRTIGVVSPQAIDTVNFSFTNWLHGGTQTQTIATPSNDTSYTALFDSASQNTPWLREPDSTFNIANGLDYAYYHGTWDSLPDFSKLYKEKVGIISNFDLSPRTENSNFAFRYSGYISVPANGTYTFYTSSDEGSRLYIGDSLIVDNDSLHTIQERSGQIGLKAGLHQLTVEFFEKTGDQQLNVSYEAIDIPKQLIPDSVLFREQPVNYVFTPIADAYVRTGAYTNVNISGGATTSLFTSGETPDEYQTYLRFDISSIGNDISSARLRLYGGLNNTNLTSAIVGVYNVPQWNGWLENTISYGNKPPAEATMLTSVTITNSDSQYYEWDLTQYIINLRNAGVKYISLMLKNSPDTGDNLVYFNSRENDNNKPELVVVTSQAVTQARPAATGYSNPVTKKVATTSTQVPSFSIYPNPVSNNFTIKYSPELGNRKLQVTDISGKVLKEILLTGAGIQTVRADDLKQGFYFLNIYHNNKKYFQKIIVTR